MRIEYKEDIEFFKGKEFNGNSDIYIKFPKERNYTVEYEMGGNPNVKIKSLNDLRDEYHSIGELYEFRKAYNALLFNEWGKTSIDYSDEYKALTVEERMAGVEDSEKYSKKKYDVHKSWKHHDGEDCFGGGWFIVVAILPTGQITNHYKAKDWDLFQIPAVEKAKYEFDGHTPADTLERMKQLLNTK